MLALLVAIKNKNTSQCNDGLVQCRGLEVFSCPLFPAVWFLCFWWDMRGKEGVYFRHGEGKYVLQCACVPTMPPPLALRLRAVPCKTRMIARDCTRRDHCLCDKRARV